MWSKPGDRRLRGVWRGTPRGRGLGRGCAPSPEIFFNFGPQNGQFRCTVGASGGMHPWAAPPWGQGGHVTFERRRGQGGQENLKAHTRTAAAAVLDDSIQACNAVCMMQCSFPALNDSVLHVNSFRLCTLCWLCSVVILW